MKNNNKSIYYQKGEKNKYAFVFSCPGKTERCKNKPASGQTGKNLEIVLIYLRESGFHGFTREDITITNVWPNVEFKNETKRTEASFKEIVNPENINRLIKELENVEDAIIFCGEKAQSAIESIRNGLKKSVKIIKIRHLSLQSINNIKIPNDTNIKLSKERNEKRLKKVTEIILNDLQ